MSITSSPRLFIGGLKRNVEKEEMTAEFSEFGEIVDMWIAYDPPGFAFIEFSTEAAAKAALEAKHRSFVFDCEIRVEFTKKKSGEKKEAEEKSWRPRLFVGGIIQRIEKEDIRPEFEKFGTVTDVWIAHNPPGFAFVEFDNEDSANKAVAEMNGAKLFGGTIKVQITEGRKEGRRNRVSEKRVHTGPGRRGDEFRHGELRRAPYPPPGDASYGRRRPPPAAAHHARGSYPARGPPHQYASRGGGYHHGYHDQSTAFPRQTYPARPRPYYDVPYPAAHEPPYHAGGHEHADPYAMPRDPYYAREHPVPVRPAPPVRDDYYAHDPYNHGYY